MERDLRQRTKQFALRIIKLYSSLPTRGVATVLGVQVLKAGTSVGAHYREAQRAKSNADFISKIEGAILVTVVRRVKAKSRTRQLNRKPA
jgi:four helix bundle protein